MRLLALVTERKVKLTYTQKISSANNGNNEPLFQFIGSFSVLKQDVDELWNSMNQQSICFIRCKATSRCKQNHREVHRNKNVS